MTKTTWLEIDPIDTLFFRGAESMEAGENHEVDTMFPPMPTTIVGAIRTAILGQRGIAPADYLGQPDKWQKEYPLLGPPGKPGFDLLGPLFLAGRDCLLLPVPATWYADFKDNPLTTDTPYSVQAAKPLSNSPLGLCGSVSDPFWVHKPSGNDMQPLAGQWATAAAFSAMQQGSAELVFRDNPDQLKTDEAAILPADSLYTREERVGLALTKQRTAKEGHLYSAVHIRLQGGVRIVAGMHSDYECCLDRQGILQLGGEQRVCRYQTLSDLVLPDNKDSQQLYAISPLEFSNLPADLQKKPRASGKLLRIGGWDMEKRFHKPMTAWLPAGTVIGSDSIPANLPHFLNI